MKVRKLTQAADDGFRSELATGLKATADAERLADELAFAAARLAQLATDPPGAYAQIALEPDREEAIWLAFLTAYLCPTEGDEQFAAITAAHRPWSSGELPDLDVARGPRSAHEPASGERTVLAYRAWVRRTGTQGAAIDGEPSWTPERRFARVFERLALPGLGRAGRYDFLVTLGRLGIAELRPGALQLGGDDATTTAAKRVFGIGDTLLLERRAAELAEAAGLPIEAFDLGLYNWGVPPAQRASYGAQRDGIDEAQRDAIAAALDL